MPKGPKPRPVADRFWEKVNRTETCWLWIASCRTAGYGVFFVDKEVGFVSAHRYAWMEANGPIADGLFVLHRCDVKRCVRPSHLFLGTNADNGADAAIKGLIARGSRRPTAILSEEDIAPILAAVAGGEMQKTVALRYCVSKMTISRIVNGSRWRHITHPL